MPLTTDMVERTLDSIKIDAVVEARDILMHFDGPLGLQWLRQAFENLERDHDDEVALLAGISYMLLLGYKLHSVEQAESIASK